MYVFLLSDVKLGFSPLTVVSHLECFSLKEKEKRFSSLVV